MQQFYGATACELEREGIWKDPSQFQDTDSIKYVEMEVTKAAAERVGAAPRESKTHAVRIKFLPIYHFVLRSFTERSLQEMLTSPIGNDVREVEKE